MARTQHIRKIARGKATCVVPCIAVARRKAHRVKIRHQNRHLRWWGAR